MFGRSLQAATKRTYACSACALDVVILRDERSLSISAVNAERLYASGRWFDGLA
jgi:hypothetical protein